MAKTDEIMEFLNASVTESAAGTETEETIEMPVRYETNYAMLIHDIWFSRGQFDSGHAQGDYYRVGLHTVSGQVPASIADDFCIAALRETLSVDANNMILVVEDGFAHWHFKTPILYAKARSYLVVKSNGQAGGLTAKVRIGYTIQKVSDSVFIDALTD